VGPRFTRKEWLARSSCHCRSEEWNAAAMVEDVNNDKTTSCAPTLSSLLSQPVGQFQRDRP
jgi:hypothetical protein